MVKVHSIETLGALDGPGLRTVIFFQGCPMRCGYCHNADTLSVDGGIEMSITELTDFCGRFCNYYGEDGGVTLSGGEPLMQASAALELIAALKEKGIHTALDTSGAVFVPSVLDVADLVILDLKHTDSDAFQRLTGYPQDNTLKTLSYLQKRKRRFWVRQVIVPNVTDSEAQILKLKELSVGAEKVELLPYRDAGAFKWEKLGLSYPFEGVSPPSAETMQRLRTLLE